MAALEPVRVSPFIKFCRWSLLGVGILYGMARYESLKVHQTARRNEYERTRPEREAKAKAERERLLAAENAALDEIINPTPQKEVAVADQFA